jgi:hypothetical protein
MKYQSKETIEAIGFQELVEIALATEGTNIVNGVPWSFHYEGWPVTHENDDQYLIGIAGGQTAKFNRGDFLVIDETRHLWVMSPEELHKLYAPKVLQPSDSPTPRTDAVVASIKWPDDGKSNEGDYAAYAVMLAHANQLEVELATATRLCARETIRAHDAEEELSEARDAYQNMKAFAEANGLDTTTTGTTP